MSQSRCSRCHRPHGDETATCRVCLEKCKAYYQTVREKKVVEFRELYRDLKARGICIKCRCSSSEDDTTYCRPCLDINLASAQERRDQLRKKGKCVSCGRKKSAKTKLCRPCLDRYKTYKTYSCKCGLVKFHGERLCAVCASVGPVGRKVPYVLRAMRMRGWSSVYDIAADAETTTRTVWRVLTKLKAINAVSRMLADDELTALWKLEVAS